MEEILGPLEEQLLEDGNVFHQEVEAEALPAPKAMDLPELLATDAKLLGLPVLENADLLIRGAPDGVDAAAGALLPVEIKSTTRTSVAAMSLSSPFTGSSSSRFAPARSTSRRG